MNVNNTTHPSNWIKLPLGIWFGTPTGPSCNALLVFTFLFGDRSIVFTSSSSGFGCININGNSATKSLQIWRFFEDLSSIDQSKINGMIKTYPPKIGPPIQSLTLTLYWTIIPKFSRCDWSAILWQKFNEDVNQRSK